MPQFSQAGNPVAMSMILIVLSLCASGYGDNQADPFTDAQADLEMINLRAMKMAIEDLSRSFPKEYAQGEEYLRAVDSFDQQLPQVREGLRRRDPAALEQAAADGRLAAKGAPLQPFARFRAPLAGPA